MYTYMEDDIFDSLEDENGRILAKIKTLGFAYPGARNDSAQRILHYIPYRKKYVEPCGGSGVIMQNRVPSALDVFNDRCSGVTAFFKCLQKKSLLDALTEKMEVSVYSQQLWEEALNYGGEDHIVERAYKWFLAIHCSFGGKAKAFGRSLDGNGTKYNRFGKIAEHVRTLHQRWSSVQIENCDIMEMIERYDDDNTVWFIDPTTINTKENVYAHNMSTTQHILLLDRIMSMRGYVVLFGYQNDTYDSYKWDDVITWSNGGAFNTTNITETLWIKS